MMKRSTPSSPPNLASGHATQASDWPTPQPGDVLSYAYLWHREAETGKEEGLKDRPVVVVLASELRDGQIRLHVAPVTHAQPQQEIVAVELSAAVKRDLRLDRERRWVVCDESNRFIWPGPDIRPLDNGQPYYGAIPDWLFAEVRTAFAAVAGRRAVKATPRSS